MEITWMRGPKETVALILAPGGRVFGAFHNGNTGQYREHEWVFTDEDHINDFMLEAQLALLTRGFRRL